MVLSDTEKCAFCYFCDTVCSSSCFFKPYFPAGRIQDLINVHKAYKIPNVLEQLRELTQNDRHVSLLKIIEEANSHSEVEALRKTVRLEAEERGKVVEYLSELNAENKILISDENTVFTDSVFQEMENTQPREDTMHEIFSEDQLNHFKKAFSKYAVDGHLKEQIMIMPLMENVGEKIDEKAYNKIMKDLTITPEKRIGFSDFLEIMVYWYKIFKDLELENEFISDFKGFDISETGFVTKEEAKMIITSMAPKVSKEEVEEILCDADEQVIKYEELAEKLMHMRN